MVKHIKLIQESFYHFLFYFKIREIEILKNMPLNCIVVMETSSREESNMSYPIIARSLLGKVIKFSSVCFKVKKKLLTFKAAAGKICSPPPLPPDLNRGKVADNSFNGFEPPAAVKKGVILPAAFPTCTER